VERWVQEEGSSVIPPHKTQGIRKIY